MEPPLPNFPVSPTILAQNGTLMVARLSADGQWLLPVAAKDMGPWLPRLAVAIEDGRFYSHPGLDIWALGRAIGQNISQRRVVSGASTIAAQTVRLLRPRPRSLRSKFLEFGEGIKLRKKLGPDQLLELYLNIAPFGGNLKGVGAASWAYFRKKPADLSLAESATLVAILRGPAIYRPDRHPRRAKERRNFILKRLAQKGLITEKELAQALKEPLSGIRRPFPNEASHLGDLVFRNHQRSWVWGAKDYMGLKSSIDFRAQANLKNRLSQAIRPFLSAVTMAPSAVTAAGAILDTQTGQILAYVGNARDQGPFRYVDCALAKRSSGSTLKPFIYLQALEDGLFAPASLLADTPLGFAGQAPRNFDNTYQGPVSAQVALAESLNAPAVRVLRSLGQEKAQNVLKRAGFQLSPHRHYGDSLILGGLETSLWELLGAYATLARGGRGIRPTFLANQDPSLLAKTKLENEKTLESVFPSAPTWLVNQILATPGRWPRGLANQGLALKTGTSPGFRDAWIAAYRPDIVIVLWLGDPSGQSQPGVSGLAALAAPVALLARDLGPGPSWPEAPEGVESYRACPISGEPVGPFCPGEKKAFRLTKWAKTKPCAIHVKSQGQIVAKWPLELASFMARKTGANSKKGLAIVSPRPDMEIRLTRTGEALPLKCEGAKGPVYWYVDGEFFAKAGPGRSPVWPLTPGRHVVTVVEGNRLDSSVFTAKAVFEPEIPIIKLGLKRGF
jgi:penicillin-binding protein 1C